MGSLTHVMRGGRGIVAAAISLTLVLGCAPLGFDSEEDIGGSPDEAHQMVEDWFVKASTGADDGGWSLLYPGIREALIGDVDAYQEVLRTADWDGLDYRVGEVFVSDGEYWVTVHVAGGVDQVPDFMRRWGLIQFTLREGRPTDEGQMVVRIEPDGRVRGIQASGGP